ncbi:MAG: hypothetical protein WBH03_14515, partial [Cyclobacteriaceae bacterium]
MGMLAVFFLVPYLMITTISSGSQGQMIISVILGLLFLGVVGSVVWFTLIVRFDADIQQVRFIYPFRFQTYSYSFQSIFGFRYKLLPGEISYKALQFRAKDGRKFTISDFETANLRGVERFCLTHLELRRGKSFEKLNESQRKGVIRDSLNFDVEQARDIRFYLGLGLVITFSIIGISISRMETLSTAIVIPALLFAFLIAVMVVKLIDVQKIIKK